MVVAPRGVVVAPARGFGEGIVCVVDLLEFLGARGAFGRIGGDAVRVRFQGLSVRGWKGVLVGEM